MTTEKAWDLDDGTRCASCGKKFTWVKVSAVGLVEYMRCEIRWIKTRHKTYKVCSLRCEYDFEDLRVKMALGIGGDAVDTNFSA